MGVRVLGRPALVGAAGVSEIRGDRQVGLLALLAAHRGRPVRRALLEDELWRGAPVSPSALRVNVGRLRDRFMAVTGSNPVVGDPGSYRLDLADGALDSACFDRAIVAARDARGRGDLRECVRSVRAGEALWGGEPFEGVTELPSVRAEHTRLSHLRQEGREMLAGALLGLGDHQEAIEALEPVLAADPYRESAWGLKIVALYRAGRQREALATYEEVRRLLGDEIGIEPGRALVDLERGILEQVATSDLGADLLRVTCVEVDRSATARSSPTPSSPTSSAPLSDLGGDRRSRRSHHRAAAGKPPAALVGRGQTLALATDFLDDRMGSSILVLEGPPGIGKSTVGVEIAKDAESRGLRVAWGSCPRDPAAGMVPVRQILSDVLGLVGGRDGTSGSILAALEPTFPELALSPTSGGTNSSDGVDSPTVTHDPTVAGRSADRSPEAFRSGLYLAAEQLLASATPLLVVIDDAQWITESGARILEHLAGTVEGAMWLVLARPSDRSHASVEFLAAMARHRAVWQELTPLSPHDTARLVEGWAPDRSDEWSEWSDVVADRSGGNPFFATELVRHLSTGGNPEAIPRGIEAVLTGEVNRLQPDAGSLVRVVAVAGTPHPTDALVTVAGVDAEQSRTAIVAALDAGLISSDECRSQLWPAHDLVRGAVEGLLDVPETRRIHGELAEELAGWGASAELDRFRHLLQAGPTVDVTTVEDLAAKILRRLSRQAIPHDVVRLGTTYLDAIGGQPRTRSGVEANLTVAAAHFAAGQSAEATQVLESLEPILRSLDDPGLRADAILTRSSFSLTPAESLEWAAEGQSILQQLGSDQHRHRLQLACWIGHHQARAGETGPARRMSMLADGEVDATSDPSDRALVLGLQYQIGLAVDAGPSDADQIFKDLAHLAEQTNDPGATISHQLVGLDRALRTGTLTHYEAALTSVASLPFSLHRADARWWVAAAHAALDLARGDLGAAAGSYLHAMSLGSELGVGTALSTALLHRMLLDWDTGSLGDFCALLPPPTATGSMPLLVAQGLILAEAGDLEGATTVAGLLAVPDALVCAGPSGWPLLASVGAEIAWRTGHVELARALAPGLDSHVGSGLSVAGIAYLGAADRALGLLAATLDDLDAALVHLQAAVDDDRRRGAPRWAARSAHAVADVLTRRDGRGNRAEAKALRALAADLNQRPATGPGDEADQPDR